MPSRKGRMRSAPVNEFSGRVHRARIESIRAAVRQLSEPGTAREKGAISASKPSPSSRTIR